VTVRGRARSTGWVPFAPVAMVVVHIVCAVGCAAVGAFPPRERAQGHRTAGRVPVGPAHLVRLGSGTAACPVPGGTATRRGDPGRHGAGMTRDSAPAGGAGTPVVTRGVGEAVPGVGGTTTDLAPGAGRAVHLAVAGAAIRRRRTAGARSP
jgi:hypothetical protein